MSTRKDIIITKGILQGELINAEGTLAAALIDVVPAPVRERCPPVKNVIDYLKILAEQQKGTEDAKLRDAMVIIRESVQAVVHSAPNVKLFTSLKSKIQASTSPIVRKNIENMFTITKRLHGTLTKVPYSEMIDIVEGVLPEDLRRNEQIVCLRAIRSLSKLLK